MSDLYKTLLISRPQVLSSGGSGLLTQANNLSDVADVTTARNNLGAIDAAYVEPIAATRAPLDGLFYGDGATTAQRVYWPTPAAAVIDTSDFAVSVPIFGLTRRSGQTNGIWMLTSSADGTGYAAGAFTVRIDPTDALRIRLGDDANYRQYSITAASFYNLYAGQTGVLTITRTAGVIAVYWNTTAVTLPAETTLGSAPAWTSAIPNASFVIGSLFSGAFYPGPLGAPFVLNRALTAAEITQMMQINALLPVDRLGGSMVAVTAGSFTARRPYRILTVGTTDYTLIGASANTVGVEFTATGVGSGTGTALAIGAVLQPEITRTSQVLDHGPNRIRGICTAGVRPLCDRDAVPFEFVLTTTGAFVTGASTNPLWFENGMLTEVYATASTAGADIILRRNSSSTNDIVTASTDIPTTNPTRLTLIDAQRNFSSGETLWGSASTGTITIRGFWTRR
jgi:hypothetical protein